MSPARLRPVPLTGTYQKAAGGLRVSPFCAGPGGPNAVASIDPRKTHVTTGCLAPHAQASGWLGIGRSGSPASRCHKPRQTPLTRFPPPDSGVVPFSRSLARQPHCHRVTLLGRQLCGARTSPSDQPAKGGSDASSTTMPTGLAVGLGLKSGPAVWRDLHLSKPTCAPNKWVSRAARTTEQLRRSQALFKIRLTGILSTRIIIEQESKLADERAELVR